ncbi:MAG: hypothetical protein KDD69_02460 [Bdellovibrionales bacterium]|nr:hypothetical protein [Bdellovibrionales bacterium]
MSTAPAPIQKRQRAYTAITLLAVAAWPTLIVTKLVIAGLDTPIFTDYALHAKCAALAVAFVIAIHRAYVLAQMVRGLPQRLTRVLSFPVSFVSLVFAASWCHTHFALCTLYFFISVYTLRVHLLLLMPSQNAGSMTEWLHSQKPSRPA